MRHTSSLNEWTSLPVTYTNGSKGGAEEIKNFLQIMSDNTMLFGWGSIAHISLRRSSENYVSPSGKLPSGETPFLLRFFSD